MSSTPFSRWRGGGRISCAERKGKGATPREESGKGRGENRGAGPEGRGRLRDATETPGEPRGGRGAGPGAAGKSGGGAGGAAGRGRCTPEGPGPGGSRAASAFLSETRRPGRGRGCRALGVRGSQERRGRCLGQFLSFRLGQLRGPGRLDPHLPPGISGRNRGRARREDLGGGGAGFRCEAATPTPPRASRFFAGRHLRVAAPCSSHLRRPKSRRRLRKEIKP